MPDREKAKTKSALSYPLCIVVAMCFVLVALAPGAGSAGPEATDSGSTMYTVMVIDTSGSMADYTTDDVLSMDAVKNAAHCLVWLVRGHASQAEKASEPASDMVALVSFSDDAQVLSPLTRNLDALDSAIDKLVPGDFTNIGAGLQKANELMETVPEECEKNVFLIVDGKNNKGYTDDEILSEIAGRTIEIGASIYTIGFNGNREALDEGLLQGLSAETGGRYQYARNAWWLASAFAELRLTTLGRDQLEWSGDIGPVEEKAAGTAEIPPGTGEIHSVLNRSGSMVGLGIVDPEGNRVGRDYPDASIYTENDIEYVIINRPESGNWKYCVSSYGVPEGQTSYFLSMVSRPEAKPDAGTSGNGELVLYSVLGAMALGLVIVVGLSIRKRRGKDAYPSIEGGSRHCGICGRTLEPDWNRCPYCGSACEVTGTENGAGPAVRGKPRRDGPSIAAEKPVGSGGECQLRVTRGTGEGGYYAIDLDLVNIGRDPSNHLVLDDELVSGRHARLYRAEGGFFLEDLGSTNGTFVDDRMVVTAWLVNGASIKIGGTEFELEINNP